MDSGADEACAARLSRRSADTSLPKATSYAATSLFGAPPLAARTSPAVAVASEPTAES
eukprot:CAMPEP_0172556210 /NCGR_PEP_ID=MMETSP1067-20121228/64286_1 /TAXON_ID=265564 ORGANISM="Thalassiosira punctigera, Strain Tpunct2005C2" /NCGR_SAMPLE_ID=MMETSP1067 /ASSEMBLY_ACC=CAM_ASM_000444 /LENGTH=57 /DNA_ID=CAMNT_0013344951 /DNA_START=1 /DNA_END=171 /DNA_ORIENTATION=-